MSKNGMVTRDIPYLPVAILLCVVLKTNNFLYHPAETVISVFDIVCIHVNNWINSNRFLLQQKLFYWLQRIYRGGLAMKSKILSTIWHAKEE